MEAGRPGSEGGPEKAPGSGRQTGEPTADALERAIETLLERRRPGATICPSEAARAVASGRGEPWRPLVPPAMEAAARLAAQGRVEITQTGRVVDMATARGPVRIRAARPSRPSAER